jgi:hypothetical protein
VVQNPALIRFAQKSQDYFPDCIGMNGSSRPHPQVCGQLKPRRLVDALDIGDFLIADQNGEIDDFVNVFIQSAHISKGDSADFRPAEKRKDIEKIFWFQIQGFGLRFSVKNTGEP